MKKFNLLLISVSYLFIINHCFGQTKIHESKELKSGIYLTHNEFKNNAPSIDFEYEVSAKTRRYGLLGIGGKIIYYRINIDKKKAKQLGKVYGFCDGSNVYINPEMLKFYPKTEFSKIEYLNKLSYFEDILCTTTFNPNNSTTSTSCSLARKIVNIDNGEVTVLTKKSLRNLISDNPQLLNRFENESRKNKKLKDYFLEYMNSL